jgi:hypothetical protein
VRLPLATAIFVIIVSKNSCRRHGVDSTPKTCFPFTSRFASGSYTCSPPRYCTLQRIQVRYEIGLRSSTFSSELEMSQALKSSRRPTACGCGEVQLGLSTLTLLSLLCHLRVR